MVTIEISKLFWTALPEGNDICITMNDYRVKDGHKAGPLHSSVEPHERKALH